MKSESEKLCKKSFDKYLRKIKTDLKLIWKDVEQKDEPPDYYLYINNIKYAVEVTILINKVNVGLNNHYPVGIIRDYLEKFVTEEVETSARQNNILKGNYLVVFSKPIYNFTEVKNIIQSKLLSYIYDTRNADKAPQKVIYKKREQECIIEKVDNKIDNVVMGGPIILKWEGEILDEAILLLNDRLDDKEIKLRNIYEPKIILLHDQYPFSGFKNI